MHTIKGSGSMCGFPNLSTFTHEFETAFDRVRQGEITVTKELVEIGLDSHEFITQIVHSYDHLTPTLREESKRILNELRKISPFDENGVPLPIEIPEETKADETQLDKAH